MRVGVAGAGIVGSVVARALAEAGHTVVVVDPATVATGASSVPRAAMHPFTGIRPRWDEQEQAQWRNAWSFYGERAPAAVRGTMWLLRLPPNERTAAIWRSRFDPAPVAAAGVASWLPSDACHALQPGLSADAARWGGLLVHEVPFVDGVALCTRLLDHSGITRQHGFCRWDRDSGSVVVDSATSVPTAVVPDFGRVDAWVLATGASPLPGLEVPSPLAPMAGEVLVVELDCGASGMMPGGVIGYRSHITPVSGRRLMLSATYDEHGAGLVGDGSGRGWRGLLDRLAEVMPRLADRVRVVGAWSGVRPTAAGVRDGEGARVMAVADGVWWATGTGSRGLLESPGLAAGLVRELGAKTTKPPAGAQ